MNTYDRNRLSNRHSPASFDASETEVHSPDGKFAKEHFAGALRIVYNAVILDYLGRRVREISREI